MRRLNRLRRAISDVPRIHLVNPITQSFGVAMITPRWLYVLAAATGSRCGDPRIVDEALEGLDVNTIEPGDVVGIGIHTGNARADALGAERFALTARLADLPDDLVFYTQITIEAAEDPAFLRAMRRANIRGALVGVESVTADGLKDVYKGIDLAVLGSFILGLPSDTQNTFDATHKRPRLYAPYPTMSLEEIRLGTQGAWERFYSWRHMWARSRVVESVRARIAFVLISKLYRHMYANTGIATDSARVQRSARWARLIGTVCRKLFLGKPMPELAMPVAPAEP